MTERPRLVQHYARFLPVTAATPALSLGEGFTPLVQLRRLGASLGLRNLYAKVEGTNPTGSFKDRGMVLAVSRALETGATAVICASTGNTSASAAAYAAAAGIECVVVLPRGQIATGKLVQTLIAGARVVAVDANFDQALTVVRALAEQDDHPVAIVNSVNPDRLEGQKTAAFEICDDLGRAPDILALPVGNAGNITAYWAGYQEYALDGPATRTPRMWGFQAAGAAPIVLGEPVADPDTVATAIRIGNPASWHQAIAARDQSLGRIDSVTDIEILAAHRWLSAREGVFVEPASAAGIAGLLAAHERGGEIPPGATIVATVTGHGLKDPQWALRTADGDEVAATKVGVDEVEVAGVLGLG